MSPSGRMPRDTFADRLMGLESAEFVAFVADLFEARGWRVEAGGRVLELGRSGDPSAKRRSVAVVAATDATGDVDGSGRLARCLDAGDLVVAARRTDAVERLATEAGVPVVGASGLYDRLLYGIDREVADDLCREHLGRSVAGAPSELANPERGVGGGGSNESGEGGSAEASPPPEEPPGETAGRPGRPDVTPRHLVAGLAVVAVVALVAIGASGGLDGTPLGGSGPTAGAGEVGPSTASSVPTTAPTAAAGGSPTPRATATRTASEAAWLDRRYVEVRASCERPPGLVAVVIVGALRNNDPETNDGVRTAWNFSSHASVGSTYRSFSSFLAEDRFDPLFDHRRAAYAPVYRDPGIAAFDVTVTAADGSQHTYLMAFTNEAVDTARGSVPIRDVGEEEGCWRLAGIMPR